jgi:hypothetical protein
MATKVPHFICLAVVTLTTACSHEAPRARNPKAVRPASVEIAGIKLVRAETAVGRECLDLARRVGYPLPCPRLLPEYATPYWGRPTGNNQFFQAGRAALRGWVTLSVNFVHSPETDDHLVISAAPKRVDARHLVFKPRPYPGAELRPAGHTRLHGREAKWFYVSQGESIYLGHTVLVWSEAGHTYAVGFHGRGTVIRELGLAVARRISLSP